jgi:hypothetical protein
MQRWFTISKLLNIIYHINMIKNKKSYDHLNRCRKTVDEIQYHFTIKALNKLGLEKIILNIIIIIIIINTKIILQPY